MGLFSKDTRSDEDKAADKAAKDAERGRKAEERAARAAERSAEADARAAAEAVKRAESARKAFEKNRTKAIRAGVDVEGAVSICHYIDDLRDNFLVIFPDRVDLVIGKKGGNLTNKGAGTESIPMSRISSVEIEKSMMTATLKIHTSGNAILFKGFTTEAEPARQEIQRLMRSAASTESTSMGTDAHDQLRKLAALHADGILTDEEFATKKADLLNRM